MGCKSILSVKSQSRLVGGADVPEKVEEPLNPTTEATKEVIFTTVEETKDTLKTANEISTISDGPCYFFSAQVSGSTGYKCHCFFKTLCDIIYFITFDGFVLPLLSTGIIR